jgi:hypothetical protein
MNISTGSPLWQAALLFIGVVFLVFEAWRGWRAGVIRAGLNLAAILVSSLVGYLAAQIAVGLFGGLTTPPGFVAGAIVGGGLGLVVFLLIWLVGVLLFKRTAQHGGLMKVLWGGGGAVFGLLLGLFVLWSGITIVRGLGAFAEGQAETATRKNAKAPPAAGGLVTLKESLELGKAGEFFQSVDVVPKEMYDIIAQVSQVVSDQDAMLRFIEYPGIQELMQNPKITALLSDPAVLAAAEKRNFIALMGNKSLIAAAEDPELGSQIRKIDLQAALKYAVAKPSPAPAKTP